MVGQRPLPYLLSELFLFFLTHTHTTSRYTYIFEIFTFLHVEAKIIAWYFARQSQNNLPISTVTLRLFVRRISFHEFYNLRHLLLFHDTALMFVTIPVSHPNILHPQFTSVSPAINYR